MKFVRLTKDVLIKLRLLGFNILRAPMSIEHQDPTWYPLQVENVWEYIDDLSGVPFEEDNVLVIDDAIDNIREEDLIGSVWMI
ncbi:hypothetical protein HP439_13000 [Sphingobacterium shayense]|uniref:hypothetical protein n=1 Tax=Sphingobacterium shayense TaxID=626343 RepID=UPI0015580AD5|nr:hypothetical protein [Sphingobacterium shayense]NQD71640.1 hypothetical protein [Sphingobacterium shayense]